MTCVSLNDHMATISASALVLLLTMNILIDYPSDLHMKIDCHAMFHASTDRNDPSRSRGLRAYSRSVDAHPHDNPGIPKMSMPGRDVEARRRRPLDCRMLSLTARMSAPR